MAPSRRGDLSASMVVLGLVIKQSDTAAGVGARLIDQFPSARWSRSIAHNALSSLAERGSVRMIQQSAERAPDRYEATPEGEDEFAEWLHASLAVPPALRDAMHLKLALCEDDDLPWMIRVIREQEEACMRAGEAAQVRFNRARRSGRLSPANGADLRSRVQSAMMTDEVTLWGYMGKRLQRFRQELEGPDGELELLGGGGDEDG
jgi:hypothetical protein